jgi:hypothetical protein
MTTQAEAIAGRERRYGKTQRVDRWWLEPVLVAVGLGAFIVYSTISAVLGDRWPFEIGPYLSPLYEPLIRPAWLPSFVSPAMLILPVPLAFRATCYYYRRAYYRSFFMSPPACAVLEPARSYSGETRFPLILQKLHRYALYLALIFNVLLWIGAVRSFYYEGEIGIGLGSIVMTINAFLLMMYSLSCHSLRHIVGGGLDCFSCSNYTKARYSLWELVTKANEHHRLYAWASLIFVGVTDLYIHLVASGVITDPHTWSSF